MPTYSLDLGCGPTPKNFFNADIVYGIDVRDELEKNIYKADLITDKIPFDDAFFDFVTAHDFIEHIPRVLYTPNRSYPFVELMNEIWRVLKPSGKLYSLTPAFPAAAAFFDPTHLNFVTELTFSEGFSVNNPHTKAAGFKGEFKIESQNRQGPYLISILKKVEST